MKNQTMKYSESGRSSSWGHSELVSESNQYESQNKFGMIADGESGRTMLEMLGVLAIMGIIMYGAIAGINYGMSTYKINQTYNEVQDAVQGIQDLYSWSPRYEDPSMQTHVCENDIFTNCSGGNISSPFGSNDIFVASADDDKTFVITYRDIEQASCNRLKEMEWGTIVMDSECGSPIDNIKFCPKTQPGQTSCPN